MKPYGDECCPEAAGTSGITASSTDDLNPHQAYYRLDARPSEWCQGKMNEIHHMLLIGQTLPTDELPKLCCMNASNVSCTIEIDTQDRRVTAS